MPGRLLHADRGYDPDRNCAKVYEMGMVTSIKQRKNQVNRDKPDKKRAARAYDPEEYKNRSRARASSGPRRQ